MDLIDAIIENNIEMVKELLQNGADPNTYLDDAMVRPLHFAAQDNRVEIGQLLIARGADLGAYTYPEKLTPLDVAKLHGHDEFIELLMQSHND
jgi:ankyrin repeat protein